MISKVTFVFWKSFLFNFRPPDLNYNLDLQFYRQLLFLFNQFFSLKMCLYKILIFEIEPDFALLILLIKKSCILYGISQINYFSLKNVFNLKTCLQMCYVQFTKSFTCQIYIQSTKIILLPPKYEIIMVPSNH